MKTFSNNLFLLFIIILTLISLIYASDCSKCTPETFPKSPEENCKGKDCGRDCKWFQIDSNTAKCLSCEVEDDKYYYTKSLTIDGQDIYCRKLGIDGFPGRKIINGTNQIVTDCLELGLYHLGDVCHHFVIENAYVSNKDTKELKCKYFNYQKTFENGLKTYICLDEEQGCDAYKEKEGKSNELKYFDADTKECLVICPDDKIRIAYYIHPKTRKKYYQCSKKCDKNGYDKEYTIQSIFYPEKNITYCYDLCPEEAPYYYDEGNGIKTCVKECNRNKTKHEFFVHSDRKCSSNVYDCGVNFHFLINGDKKYYECLSGDVTIQRCEFPYPYRFVFHGITYCLSNCKDSQNEFFEEKRETHLIIEKNECVYSDSDSSEYYKDELNRWVDCKKSLSGPFHDGDKCVRKCVNKYYVEDTYECVSNCGIGYKLNKETNSCYKNCPKYLGIGFIKDNNFCVRCEKEGNEKGYYIKGSETCTSSCDENHYYDYNDNICYTGNCQSHGKFFISENIHICYNSCSDIQKVKKINYNFFLDFQCFKNKEDIKDYETLYYYETSSQKFRYFSNINTAILECYKNGNKYIEGINGKKCISKCNSYHTLPKENEFGICFDNQSKCKEYSYLYFNSDTKICSKECNGYIVVDSDEKPIYSESNCVDECPDNFPFIKEITARGIKYCKKECSFYSILENNKKKCEDKCESFYFLETNGVHRCVDYCYRGYENNIPKFIYYLNNDNNKFQCVDSCKINSITDKFSIKAINQHEQCRNICPSNAPYYYENEQFCLKKCDKYYKSSNPKICVDHCENNEFIHPGNICSINSCPKSAPFYILENNLKFCVVNCFDNGYYYFNKDGKCENNKNGKYSLYGLLVDECGTNFSKNEKSKICERPTFCDKIKITYHTETISQSYLLSDTIIKYSDIPITVSDTIDVSNNNFKIIENGSGVSCSIIMSNSNIECKYITSIGQCVEKCPKGENFLIPGSNICQKNCGSFQYFTSKEVGSDNTYNIYLCSSSCTGNKVKHEKECIDCNDNFYKYKDSCYYSSEELLKKNPSLNNEITNLNVIIYQNNCKDFSIEKKVCNETCIFSSYRIYDVVNRKCVSSCSETSKPYLKVTDQGYICEDRCPDEIKRYSSNNICQSKCHFLNYNSNQCLTSCPKNKTIIDNEIYCTEECQISNYYFNYSPNLICVSNCNSGDYVLENTKICIKNENSCIYGSTQYLYYEMDSQIKKDTCVQSCEGKLKKYQRLNYHCDSQCNIDPDEDYYNNEDNNLCINECVSNYKYKDGKICKTECRNKYEKDNVCVETCSNIIDNYFNEICDIAKLDKKKCSCCDRDNYEYKGYCTSICPKQNKFFYENNMGRKECKTDCNGHSYYKIISDTDYKLLYECLNTCDVEVSDVSGLNLIPKLCFDNKCQGNYRFFKSNGQNKYKCYGKCPDNDMYSEYNECLESCGNDYIQFEDSQLCILYKDMRYYDYKNKKSVHICPKGQKFIYRHTANVSVCLENCGGYNIPLYLNFENRCVKQCNETESDGTNFRCDCKNLYFFNIIMHMRICLDPNEKTCEKIKNYPYVYISDKSSKECISTCNGTLSLDGEYCYDKKNFICPNYTTKQKNKVEIYQCICDNRFFYKTADKKDIVCLGPDIKCGIFTYDGKTYNRSLLINGTKQCVEYCPFDIYTIEFGSLCIDKCPENAKLINNKCTCVDLFYKKDEQHFCLQNCNSEYPLLINKTRECVKRCPDEYVYYKDICYNDCNNFKETTKFPNINSTNFEIKLLNELYGKKGNNVCFCKGTWYYNNETKEIGCNENQMDSCISFIDLGYKFFTKQILRCDKQCQPDYPYFFNDNCYLNCNEGNENRPEHYKLKQVSKTYECQCIEFWKYTDMNQKECVESVEGLCPNQYLLIKNTSECHKGSECPKGYYFFNNICYDKCPTNTGNNQGFPNNCSCLYYWYLDDKNNFVSSRPRAP